MLDSDLAKLYKVSTGSLNRAVQRNTERFPPDFSFRLTKEEYKFLRFEFGILEKGKHSKYLPRVFTEHGVAMLSSVLKSKQAVLINIAIMRAFAKLRQLLSTNKDLMHKLEEHDRKLYSHDKNIRELTSAIHRMISTPEPKRNPIGFGPRGRVKN